MLQGLHVRERNVPPGQSGGWIVRWYPLDSGLVPKRVDQRMQHDAHAFASKTDARSQETHTRPSSRVQM